VIAPRPPWIIAAVDIVGMIGVGLISPTLGPDGTLIFTFGIGSFALMGALLLSQPLRRRVQAPIDRQFDRARYDAQRTAEGFAERIRNEVDLVAVRGGLTAVATEAVRPVGASVWLRAGLTRQEAGR
jgi:hypothetical protein